MQLPPTIISLNHNKKKKQDLVLDKATGGKKTIPGVKPGSRGKPTTTNPPLVHVSQDEDQTKNSTDGSDEEEDTLMKGDEDAPSLTDETEVEASISEEKAPSLPRTLRRGALEPPRTLEITLFNRLEKMYGPGIKRLLNVQYRYGVLFAGKTACSIYTLLILG